MADQPLGEMKPFLRPGVVFSETQKGCDVLDLIDLRHLETSPGSLAVLKRCNGKHTVEEIVSAVADQSSLRRPELESSVPDFIASLIDRDILLSGDPVVGTPAPPPSRPGVVFLEVTRSCNLNCVWCYNNSRAALARELTCEQWKRCIDRLGGGDCTLLFTGGEPLARKDLIDIAQHAKQKGFRRQLFTNGTLVNERNVDALAATFDYVRITIDGATAETNDLVRGKGSFDRALRGMRMLIDAGVRVCWQCIVSRHNIRELPAILDKAIEVGASGIRMASVDALGRGCSTRDLELSPAQEFFFWRYLAWAMEEFKSRIQIDWGADYCLEQDWSTVMSIEPGKAPSATPAGRKDPRFYMKFARTSACGVGVRSFLINPEGFIGLCPLLTPPDVVLGHALTDDPLEVWQRHPVFSVFRQMRLEDYDDCAQCGFRYRCMAGCRGRAYQFQKSLTRCDEKMLKYFVLPREGNTSPTPSPAS